MRYTGINHLALVTPDMDATVRFWRDLLGMRLVAGLGRPGYRHYFFEISRTDTIAFFEWRAAAPMPEKDHGVPVAGPAGFDHVAIGVAADGDLWEVKARLEAAGFWVSEAIDHGFIHSVYAFDPHGVPIEFSCPAVGRDVHETPRMGDSRPCPAARTGPEPDSGAWPNPARTTAKEDQVLFPGEGLELYDGED